MTQPKRTSGYRIEWNDKIKKFQIKIPGFNVAVAEFYDNAASSRADIEAMFAALAGIPDPADALAKVRDAILEAINFAPTIPLNSDREKAMATYRAALALLPAPKEAR